MDKLKLVSQQEIKVRDVTMAMTHIIHLMNCGGATKVEGKFWFHGCWWTYCAYVIKNKVGPPTVRVDLREEI